MLSSGLYAQSIIINPDGTHSVVIDHGVHKVIVNPNGTHSVAVSSGISNIIVNPDGTHSQIMGEGTSKIIVNPNEPHSTVTTQGDSQRVLIHPNSGFQPFFFKKQGDKMIILPNGSILHFKKMKKKRKHKI